MSFINEVLNTISKVTISYNAVCFAANLNTMDIILDTNNALIKDNTFDQGANFDLSQCNTKSVEAGSANNDDFKSELETQLYKLFGNNKSSADTKVNKFVASISQRVTFESTQSCIAFATNNITINLKCSDSIKISQNTFLQFAMNQIGACISTLQVDNDDGSKTSLASYVTNLAQDVTDSNSTIDFTQEDACPGYDQRLTIVIAIVVFFVIVNTLIYNLF